MPEDIFEKRVKEMEKMGKDTTGPATATTRTGEHTKEGTTKKTTEPKVGILKKRPGLQEVKSETSGQIQYVPAGATKFIDIVSGELETI